jgi:transcription elongation factor GreA
LRREVVEAISTARAHGDLSENFEYHAAKNEQGLLERRITILRHRLENAVLVEQAEDGIVGVGSIVEVEDEQGGRFEEVRGDAAGQLASGGGIAALLRYPVAQLTNRP